MKKRDFERVLKNAIKRKTTAWFEDMCRRGDPAARVYADADDIVVDFGDETETGSPVFHMPCTLVIDDLAIGVTITGIINEGIKPILVHHTDTWVQVLDYSGPHYELDMLCLLGFLDTVVDMIA